MICSLKPIGLLCEYSINPLGLETTTPRFSWKALNTIRKCSQSAFQIIISSSESTLSADEGDIWDSGKVESSQSVNVEYKGIPAKSGSRCWWKVKIWDNKGRESLFSDAAWFEFGLLNSKEWIGTWIGESSHVYGVSPLFRKDFCLNKEIKRARAYICGIGYYELYLNGDKVGDHVLDPGWTDYNKRVLYVTYDVGGILIKGDNAIGVMLGEGWYGHTHDSFIKYMGSQPSWNNTPRFILQLNIEFEDGSITKILSDNISGWKVCKGPIIQNSIYDGEKYDARLEKLGWNSPNYFEKIANHEVINWEDVVKVERPNGVIESQVMEPIKVVEDIIPTSMTQPFKGIYVFDMGKNFAGWVRLELNGLIGTETQMKYAEVLNEDGTVNQSNLRGAKATDTYIFCGKEQEVYEPRFTYHGFRYVQLEGLVDVSQIRNIIGRVVRSSVAKVGEFSCSNELLNQIHASIQQTESSNLHSVPTDCPQRDERMAWLNDMTVRAEESLYNFDLANLYTKWMKDVIDTQDEELGSVADTAPYFYCGKIAGHISSSVIVVPWLLYLFYGDRRILEQNYKSMKSYLDFLKNQSDDYIIRENYCGDWAPPKTESMIGDCWDAMPANIPHQVITTCYFYYDATIMEKIARELKKHSDEMEFNKLSGLIKDAFNKRFFDTATCNYSTGSQACNLFPLYLGMVSDDYKSRLLKNLVEDIEQKHEVHLTTGNQTTKYLLEVLSREGLHDLAFKLATQTTYPSWGYMIANGATTIWERWENLTENGMNSHNHPMNGTQGAWFYKYLAGIFYEEIGAGFEKFIIKPYIPNGLNNVQAVIETIRGKIFSEWKKDTLTFNMEIEIPFNCTAEIYIPKLEGNSNYGVKEGGILIWTKEMKYTSDEDIVFLRNESKYVVFEVGSGFYNFCIVSF